MHGVVPMVFLGGFDGAGKRIMLIAIRSLMEMVFPNQNVVLTLTPIGTAAVKIGGNTIHSKFGFSSCPMRRNGSKWKSKRAAG